MSQGVYSPLGGALRVRIFGTRVKLGSLGSRVLAVFHIVLHCMTDGDVYSGYQEKLINKRTPEERCYRRSRGTSRKLFMYRQRFRNWQEVKFDGCRGDWGR
jgi:hypothetical protein